MSFSRKFILDSSVHFGKKSVTVIAKEGDKIENGVSFSVQDPLYGDFSHPWEPAAYPLHLASWCKESPKGVIMLQSSLHKNDEQSSNDFTLLADRIKAGEIAWGTSNNHTGDSSFIDGYWEWLEDVLGRSKKILYKAEIYRAVYASLFSYDCNPKVLRAFCEQWCPSTNTLHTASGELSISLWDLRRLGGLPIRGEIYDEVVPSVTELLDCNAKNEYHLPRCCRFLFRAFAVLCSKKGGQQVSISSWVRFWYKRPSRHRGPCANFYRKDATCPKETRNPSGIIDPPFIRTDLDEEPFVELDVPDSIKDDVYTAAFLSCWICKFVLPTQGGNFVRPSVFKAASLMALGCKISLAIPALANIYRGLRDISTCSNLKNYKTYLPVHYIYSWLGHYFDTHYFKERGQNDVVLMATYAGEKMGKYFSLDDASSLFCRLNLLSISSLSWCEDKRQNIVDTDTITCNTSEYICSQRSSYLTMRIDDEHVFEFYNPHRFSIQFGFCQCIPGELRRANFLPATLQDVYQLWASCVLDTTNSRFIIPPSSFKGARSTLASYDEWWSKRHCTTFSRRTKIILKSKVVIPSLPKVIKVNQLKIKETKPPALSSLVQKTVIRDCTATLGSKAVPQTSIPKSKGKPLAIIEEMHKEKSFETNILDNSPAADDIESSSTENWKRPKRKASEIISNLPAVHVGNDNPFGALDDLSVPYSTLAKFHGDLDLLDEDSVLGPHSFDLHAGQVESTFSPEIVSKKNHDTAKRSRISTELASPISVQHTIDHPEPSVYCVDTVVLSRRRIFVLSLWEDLQRKISRTPLDKVASLAGEANKMIDAIAENKDVDCAPLRTLVGDFFRQAKRFGDLQTEFSQKMTSEEQAKQISAVESSITKIRAKEDDIVKGKELKQATLSSNQSRRAKLMEELENLDVADKEIEASLLEAESELSEINVEIFNLAASIETLESVPTTVGFEENQFKVLKESFEATFAELKDYKWSP